MIWRRKCDKLCRRYYIIGMLLFIVFFIIYRSIPSIQVMLEIDKCPSCFGVSLCNTLFVTGGKSHLYLDAWGSNGWLMNIIATKNVYAGKLDDRKVIVKRLGKDHELYHLDKKICNAMGYSSYCREKMKEIVSKVNNLGDSIEAILSDSDSKEGNPLLHLCPTTSHINALFKQIFHDSENINSSMITANDLTANIWTTLQINPEPIILQILQARDGWPVPHFYGCCGRICVMEDTGIPLFNFYSSPWPVKAGLALQLLLAADHFTFLHTSFSFYLLDISPDNIVVNELGKLSFIDLEDVIIVDRYPTVPYITSTWNETHVSKIANQFSTHDICSHHISDHNYFHICQLLEDPKTPSYKSSPQGLLHPLPVELTEQYPEISSLLSKCAQPNGSNRILNAQRLRDMLQIASRKSSAFWVPGLLETWNQI